ncbi:sulfate adenylyltransferase subunit 1 [Actinomycetospora cinnamomea]|uniref:sulfate adenylyltransferase n=1 Tax=Actinomycetospora cinnamomea TaxID=663609 RepID=A0A2U1F173_9PSEU|nr:GTP-binding protein [Actinomycetospora cinnamomea]PVZ05760.1 sulfate adenylyltransferase subunit 1 [Actinomycetospora cinnamomea]
MPDLLRLATAGSVDDGKSTLVGRLLYDTKSVLADQMEAVERASARGGSAEPDLSLLVDGLRSEREQGITIDVAYRYFATPTRSFVLADTPGHVQYTRNTVTGASTASLAVLLVDARHGVVEQTRRHVAVMGLLRVPRLVLAVNKMDLVDFDENTYARIAKEFTGLTEALGYAEDAVVTIPVSARHGDNVVLRSGNTPWFEGPTLLDHLESVPVDGPDHDAPFRFPVQYVVRPRTEAHPDYRGYAGLVAAGTVRVGEEVEVLPEGQRTRVEGIDTFDGELEAAHVGQSVVLRLTDDLGIARGALLAAPGSPEPVSEFDATLAWLHEKPLRPGARLLLRHGTRTVQAIVGAVTHRLDTETLTLDEDPGELAINDMGQASLVVSEPLPLDPYDAIAATGSFLLVDPQAGDTLAAGLVGRPLVARPRETLDET